MDGQTTDSLTKILKWIVLVFAAGFIGYFGRYLSKLLLERVHKRNAGHAVPLQSSGNDSGKEDHKIRKKELKLEKKRLKKLGT